MVDLLKENDALKRENAALSVEVNTLRAIVDAMANRSGSQEEVLDRRQMELAEVIAPVEDAPQGEEQDPSRDEVPSIRRKRGRKPRIPLAEKLKDLPVGKITYIIPEGVKGNEELYREIKGEESVEVVFRKASLYLHRIARRKYIKIGERESPPIVAQSPPRFSSSFVSSSLAIAIVLDKYSFHGTLYRMERKFLEMGIDLSRKTQSDAVERLSSWVRPLYELLQKKALSKRYLQIDETFIKYINGGLSGSSTGYFWAINAPEEVSVFYWIDNRRHENVKTDPRRLDGPASGRRLRGIRQARRGLGRRYAAGLLGPCLSKAEGRLGQRSRAGSTYIEADRRAVRFRKPMDQARL